MSEIDDRDEVEALLGWLTEQERLAVCLRYWKGLHLRSSGRDLGLGEGSLFGSAKNAVFRLRQLFRP